MLAKIALCAAVIAPVLTVAWMPASSGDLAKRGQRWKGNLGTIRRAVRLSTALSSLSSSKKRMGGNVVFRPSDDPDAFDSHRVGTARVHRYGRGSDDAEYVMWYHGRSASFDVEGVLPPISTGRIGRATSRNGLHWKRAVDDSSEDDPNASLGLNTGSWWAFDTAHVGLGQVLLPMSTPAVMAEGGVYLMYYMGGNMEETPLSQYLENVPDASQDATIKGMKMRIGVALSQDGLTWGRVEGDHPTGACVVPYDDSVGKDMPSIARENSSPLEEELYCGWPEVVVDRWQQGNSIFALNRKRQWPFKMFYSTMKKSSKEKVIGLAVSEDGFRWFQQGTCVSPDADGMDAGGCARCTVIQGARFVDEEWVDASDDPWTMFYEGVSKEDGKHRIMAAQSTDDGKTWQKLGVVLNVGSSDDGDWDCNGVGSPHILRMDDGSLRMYYTGVGADGSTAIGVARTSGNGTGEGEWTREQAQLFAMEE